MGLDAKAGMTPRSSLDDELARWAGADPAARAVADAVRAMARATVRIAALAARGNLACNLSGGTGRGGATDEQKQFDVIASDCIAEELGRAPVAIFVSEEVAEPVLLDAGAPLIVAADPIDGSSNIEANSAIGTIFSVLPATRAADGSFVVLQPGRNQLAAGIVVYGPATTLALTVGAGTQLYTLDPADHCFRLVEPAARIDPIAREIAINVSNYRHWDDAMRVWLDDCLRGASGPRGRDYNMRWTASPVAELQRILVRGGVFLYPGDARAGYHRGRLRLLYEASPIAFVVEQAGGTATDGTRRLLDLVPTELHEHVPVVAGASEEVEHVARLAADPHAWVERSPLFTRRGLFRTS